MTLRQKQSEFALQVAHLILKAAELGYDVTLGESWRPSETAALYAKQGKGIAGSLHTQKLAIDLNLFRDGKYLSSTEAHRPLGEWWEARGKERGIPLCWGGRFSDGNHYSLSHGGRK